jgi:hypothetical protein
VAQIANALAVTAAHVFATINDNSDSNPPRWFEEASERIRSGYSRCNDGDMRWTGCNWEPVSEPGYPNDERDAMYFGGYTFRSSSTTQFVRAVSWTAGR